MKRLKRPDTREIIFTSVKDKLEFIQKKCLEPELFEYLKQLFKSKGFDNVKITHGNHEFGKDLVFSYYDPAFSEIKWYCAIVKNKPATQNDFLPGGEIGKQIDLAVNTPYKNIKGEKINISRIFIIINGNVSRNCIDVIGDHITSSIKENIKIWDYQDLEKEFSNNCKEDFLDSKEPLFNVFMKEQCKHLSDISTLNEIYDLKIDDINEIFINVQTSFSKEIRKMNEYLSFDDKSVKFKEEEFDISKEILNSNKNYILHGIPTSGKTTLLRRTGILGFNIFSDKKAAIFYLDINEKNIDMSLKEFAEFQYNELTKGDEFKSGDFNRIIYLIDSLDFISDEQLRLNYLDKIEEFQKSDFHENIQIIIATRSLNFIRNNHKLEKFQDVELLPFNFSQAVKLVKKIIPNDQNKTNAFLKAIKNTLLDTSIQRTPLALTLMAIMYRDDKIDLKELPANIYELYNKFTDVYLDRWDSTKGINSQYKYEQLKLILGFIAFRLHCKGENGITSNDLKKFLSDLRKNYNYEELDDLDGFIEYLKTKKGVFYYENQNDTFFFFNHYFQEFFSSLILDEENDSILVDNFLSEWWSNAEVFYCGKDPKKFSFHKKINEKIIPLTPWDKLKYLNQHSKCLQASHAISISNRNQVVVKLLKEYNALIEQINLEAKNENSIFHEIPFVNLVNQTRTIFNSTFSSKHISTKEILDEFHNIIYNFKSEFNQLTLYNICYFVSFKNHDGKPLEIFSSFIKDDVVWNRILYVDINFLNLKKSIDDKVFNRLKSKMTKHKYIIQEILRNKIDL